MKQRNNSYFESRVLTQIDTLPNVPISVPYSWKNTLIEKGSLHYSNNPNAYLHSYSTPS